MATSLIGAMAPTNRLVPRFAAEPPQENLPYGRWAVTLRDHFLAAAERIDSGDEDLGEPESVVWFPDRTWHGRTYVPATARTTTGLELFGYVAFAVPAEGEEAVDFFAVADFTAETAQENPEWKLDLCDEVVGRWRGEQGNVADMTMVWGIPQVAGGAMATAELAELAVDQCPVIEDRFTLIAPDDYRGDYLEVRLWDGRGGELAVESLYADDDEDSPQADED
ncbi:MAG: hypothetical protein M3469_07375 [Actinomycetota bacterium]|nr:hypothetical protein [Solirubrobacterales bacterium]MDQ3409783.1 hypothetical protein [Actinomycetota bacterium]